MQLAIAIMAAGKGTRLKSKRPKVLHEIGGKPLLAHVIAAAAQIVPPSDIYVIVGHEAERVKAAVAATGVQFVLQSEQRGTGHAIQCAREQVKDYETLLVLSGDAPLIRPETIARMRDFHFEQLAAMTILTAVPPDPFGYGRVIRRSADSPEVMAADIVSSRKRSLPNKRRRPRSTPASTPLRPLRSSNTSTRSRPTTPTANFISPTWPACLSPPGNASSPSSPKTRPKCSAPTPSPR